MNDTTETQNAQIDKLKETAALHDLILFPIAAISSHVLYRKIAGRVQAASQSYKDAKLIAMSDQQFQEICWKAANPPPRMSERERAECRVAELEARKPRRSLVTGRYRR